MSKHTQGEWTVSEMSKPTEKQINLIKKWMQPVPETRKEASDLIGKWINKEKVLCRKCKKLVEPKNGSVSCCGIKESVSHVNVANQDFRKKLERKLFDPVVSLWNEDDQDFTDYEGMPNS